MPKITSKDPDDSLFPPNLIDKPRAGGNAPEYTVSDLSRQVKRMVEEGFGHVRVRGEIGACKLHSSGHLYFSLKDENAVLESVCWRGRVSSLGLKPATGMDVVCTGKLTTFAGQSKYQLVVESMSLAGEGALLKMLEDRRRKLEAEGVFGQANKMPLPFLPRVIGVVTSPTGAVIRDILHRLADRFPRHVLVWPVPVQGEGAAAKIVQAIEGFNNLEEGGDVPRPDVLIVARGGGSLEDLMPFNDESVVYAVFHSQIPVISAIGHETDTTLIDYAADVRAPTPTAAAEMAVPVRDGLLLEVAEFGLRLEGGMRRAVRDRKERVGLLGRALGDPMRALAPLMQRFDSVAERLTMARTNFFHRLKSRVSEVGGRLRHPRDVVRFAGEQVQDRARRLQVAWQNYLSAAQARVAELILPDHHRLIHGSWLRLNHLTHWIEKNRQETFTALEKKLDRQATLLEALSPRAVLGRGYGLVYDAQGRVVTQAAALKPRDHISIELHDGVRSAVVEE